MSDEKKETRIKVEDLPHGEKELSPEEASDVKGGAQTGDGLLLGNLLTRVVDPNHNRVTRNNTWNGPVTIKGK